MNKKKHSGTEYFKKSCMTLLLLCFNIFNILPQTENQTSPEKKFSINMENAPAVKIFEHIEKNSSFIFIFDSKVATDIQRPVSIKCKDAAIEQVLDVLLKNSEIGYVIDKRQIILRKAGAADSKNVRPSAVSKKVEGYVYDTEGEPVPGAIVQVEGSTRGVTTDADGYYSIEVTSADKLVYSFLGLETQIILVGKQKNITVRMEEMHNVLDEVTVVAFGKQKRESVIGAISTVAPGELKIPGSNLTNALAGRVAGMISYQRSGEPGQDNAEFFIRGVMTFGYKVDPLILIDNVEVTNTDLARLQADDIASFSIMKDATAAALYGARGANGVILVTTKSGREGGAKINIRLENSISQPTKNIEFANPVTFMQLHNEAALTRNPLAPLPYHQSKIDNTIAGINPYIYPATDWKKSLMKDYTDNQRVNVNVSGGGKIARYFVSGGFTNDNGILNVEGSNNFNNNIKLRTYSLRSNVNIDLFKSTELIVRLNGSFDEYIGPIHGGKTIYNMIVRSNPVMFPARFPAYQDPMVQHVMFGNAENESGRLYLNPYAELVRGYKEYSRSKMLAQVELSQNLDFLLEGFSVRAMINTDRYSYFDVQRYYVPFYYSAHSYDRRTDEYKLRILNEDSGTQSLSYAEGPKELSSVFYMETAMNYNRLFAQKHAVGGLLVYTMRQLLEANAGNLQLSLPSRNMGLAGRATYSYDSRYFVEFNFGYNGSERFSKNHRFGFFPSAGGAWSISNETFWEEMKNTLTSLRLRATYGLVGNDAIGSKDDRFYYLSLVTSGTGAKFGTDFNYSKNGILINRYANEDITWEISRKSNIALEIGLFDKLKVEAEYFHEYRKNILMTRTDIPASMGLAADIKANVGEASGRGIDLSVDYAHALSKKFRIQGRGNFTYATNKYEVYEEPQYNEPWRSRVGHPLRQEWLYIGERLFVDEYEVANSPAQFGDYMAGDIKYRDVNGDGRITTADMIPAGYPTVPEISYGFGISSGFGNWDFSVFFQGTARESFRIGVAETAPFLNNYGFSYAGISYQSNNQLLKAYADSHWSEDNRDLYALWPRLSISAITNNAQRTTWFQRNGGFLRLKQLELGYSFSGVARKFHMNDLRIYANATNLFCWSKFKLWDPEMASDGLGYPIQRVFNAGLYVTF
ncbi:MAG: TonB-dependent receptor [Tannerella sp.]|jgi:TonB-linked SusC/RagA family outer membrane protein|nr:TonB-dependent receptor [Tannerella sp.]